VRLPQVRRHGRQAPVAFGDLHDVAKICDGYSGPGEPVDAYTLFGELQERLTTPLSRVSAGQSWAPGLSSVNVDWYTPEPERARAEIDALVERMAEGFRRLEAMPPDGEAGEGGEPGESAAATGPDGSPTP
jgi:hypothetical protein